MTGIELVLGIAAVLFTVLAVRIILVDEKMKED